MTNEERGLLLTVARLLRAHMGDHMNHPDFSDIHLDYCALNDALTPFDPTHTEPVNTEDRKKAFVAELEELLRAEDDTPIHINPDGTISPA